MSNSNEKQSKLIKAMDDLCSALGEFGCEFLEMEIDCPRRNVDQLSDILHEECACENILNSQTKNSHRFTISFTTQTGTSLDDTEEEEKFLEQEKNNNKRTKTK